MNNVIKTATVRDSKGIDHNFNLIRSIGGYTFTWDGKPVDWSFTVHGYNQAVWHLKSYLRRCLGGQSYELLG